jgi:hypothetical protein
VLSCLDQDVFIVDVLNNEVMIVLVVDTVDDGLDGGIALYQNTWA